MIASNLCRECGNVLRTHPRRPNRRYCSVACRKRAEKQRYYRRHPKKVLPGLREYRDQIAARLERVERLIRELEAGVGA